MANPRFYEETTGQITIQIDAGIYTFVPATLESMQLSVFDQKTGTVLRTTEDVLNARNVTIDAAGLITWDIKPFETRFVASAAQFGAPEIHLAIFEFGWNSARQSLAEYVTFGTTLDSKEVTMNIPVHGLSVDDHLVIVDGPLLNGTEMDGVYIVNTVTDVDNITCTAKTAATATGTGAATVDVFLECEAAKYKYIFEVERVDRI